MFIGNKYKILSNPEGIVCQKCRNYTYNPFGIEDDFTLIFYKHIFPSGIFRRKKILKICKMYPLSIFLKKSVFHNKNLD
jgi:hypothetical protein